MPKRLIVQRDIENRKAMLAEGEEDNFPKGRKTMHTFVVDAKLRNNEEMCVRNPDGSFVITDNEILKVPQNRTTLSTPQLERMTAKCCRLAFTMSKDKIANIFRVHGEGIKTFQAAMSGDEATGVDNDPPFGFDMQNPDDGYPCVNLLPDGRCSYQVDYDYDYKPQRCKRFPVQVDHITGTAFGIPITTCSVTFDEDGNQLTPCDGCGAF